MLTLWQPQEELWNFGRELDELFRLRPTGRASRFSPAVDIQETEEGFVLKADLPGLDKDDIEVKIENDVLTLSGKRGGSSEEKSNGYVSRERYAGSFTRTFKLGPKVARGDIEASYKDGVLTLVLPKAEEAKPLQITVH